MINNILRKILHRKLFKGQFKLFIWLYNKKHLKQISAITKPIIGDFKIKVNTKNYIDACIYYMGDYEAYLKIHYRKLIKQSDVVLDIGANIGFHTLYFAELTGVNGKVIAFEPIKVNFEALKRNVELNNFKNIILVNKALANKNEILDVSINPENENPGAYNLLEQGTTNTKIECVKADDFLNEHHIAKVDFIKLDVEGFELEVLKGLEQTIIKNKPIIIFEYDANYQTKLNEEPKAIFNFLDNLEYLFFSIDGYGNKKQFFVENNNAETEILAMPM